jgi:hypothetical protein
VLRNENNGEFCGMEFDHFYKKCGISRKNTTPYTPPKNRFSKRMNKTFMNKSRSFLNGGGLAQ